MSEREMILQAQKESDKNGMDEKIIENMRRSDLLAEEKRIKLEQDISLLNQEYLKTLDQIT